MSKAKSELSGRALHDVHKIVFLVSEYPKKTLSEVVKMLQQEYMPAIDINAAFWRAEDAGHLIVDKKNDSAKVGTPPEKWEFGERVNALRDQIVYYLTFLARTEGDIEENYLNNLVLGYLPTDYLVAIKSLLNDRILGSYTITDTVELPVSKKQKARGKKPETHKETYVFYSLLENMEKRWGEKQFKDVAKLK